MLHLISTPALTSSLNSPSFVVAVPSLSCVLLFAAPWTAARRASLSFTISWSLLRLMSIELMMPSNYLWALVLSNWEVFILYQCIRNGHKQWPPTDVPYLSLYRSGSRQGPLLRESQDWNQGVSQSEFSSGGSEEECSSKLIQELADPAPSSYVLRSLYSCWLSGLTALGSWKLLSASCQCRLLHWPFSTWQLTASRPAGETLSCQSLI